MRDSRPREATCTCPPVTLCPPYVASPAGDAPKLENEKASYQEPEDAEEVQRSCTSSKREVQGADELHESVSKLLCHCLKSCVFPQSKVCVNVVSFG